MSDINEEPDADKFEDVRPDDQRGLLADPHESDGDGDVEHPDDEAGVEDNAA